VTTAIHKNGDVTYDINCMYIQHTGAEHVYHEPFFNDQKPDKIYLYRLGGYSNKYIIKGLEV